MSRRIDLAVPKRRAADAKPARKQPGSETVANFPVAGIGASAGGLEAFVQLLKGLPTDTGMAFVLVQHLDPKHDSQLAGLLERATQMPVCEAVDGLILRPNRVHVMPSNVLMTVASGRLVLVPRGNEMSPIDCFLRSLAADYGELAVGVILSGTGADGTAGVEAVKTAGGITFAEDSASAKFSTNAGECGRERICGLRSIAREDRHRTGPHRSTSRTPAADRSKSGGSTDRGRRGTPRQDTAAAQRPRRGGF